MVSDIENTPSTILDALKYTAGAVLLQYGFFDFFPESRYYNIIVPITTSKLKSVYQSDAPRQYGTF